MCGIVGFLDKLGRDDYPSGRVVLAMLDALACRGPDSAGVALMRRHGPEDGLWTIRLAPLEAARTLPDLRAIGEVVASSPEGDTLHLTLRPHPGASLDDLERVLGTRRGGLELICAG